jgi:mono/diheme cytochrome c family protein
MNIHISSSRLFVVGLLLAACGSGVSHPTGYGAASAMRGAHLYDNLQVVTGVNPAGDNPGYKKTPGKVTGAATWRCKECHGPDYRGVDGFYATGSHFTGVKGLVASTGKDKTELFNAIRTSCLGPTGADAGSLLSDDDVWDLVKFVREGIIDVTPYLDAGGAPIGGDAGKGKVLYEAQCMRCHDADGARINIGAAENYPIVTPVHVSYVGTEANHAAFNFFHHRVRFGLAAAPGDFVEEMPAAINFGWTMADVRDLLTYCRTLPIQ